MPTLPDQVGVGEEGRHLPGWTPALQEDTLVRVDRQGTASALEGTRARACAPEPSCLAGAVEPPLQAPVARSPLPGFTHVPSAFSSSCHWWPWAGARAPDFRSHCCLLT